MANFRGDAGTTLTVDLDLDRQSTETIKLIGIESGAGCGSSTEELVTAREGQTVDNQTPLEKALGGRLWGPIQPRLVTDTDPGAWQIARIFTLRGKPYIVGQGTESNMAVTSVWGGVAKEWCRYRVLPTHSIEMY